MWLTTSPARAPGSGRGACPDALHQRPAVRFVAENPSTVRLSGAEPEEREEGRGREGKQKLQRLHFLFFRLDFFPGGN